MSELLYKNFTKLTLEEKKLVLQWRNSDRVRLCMVNQHIIQLDEHLQWIESLKDRIDCRYYIVYLDKTPIGVLNHTNLSPSGENVSGGAYIGDEKFIGYGIPLFYYGGYDLFENLKIHSSIACILKSNKRVYKIHKLIFNAKDIKEDDKCYYVYYDRSSWDKTKRLSDMMLTFFNIKNASFVYD